MKLHFILAFSTHAQPYGDYEAMINCLDIVLSSPVMRILRWTVGVFPPMLSAYVYMYLFTTTQNSMNDVFPQRNLRQFCLLYNICIGGFYQSVL